MSSLIARRPGRAAPLLLPLPLLLAALLALLLAACAAPAARPLAAARGAATAGDFDLVARVSVTQGEARHSGRLYWRRQSGDDELALVSPFGQTVAEISVTRDRARLLAADGSVHEAADAAALTEAILGYALPVARLAGWLRARPGDTAIVAERDEHGRPLRLLDAGWEISYDYDSGDTSGAAPVRIVASRAGGPEVRLRIDEWNGSPDAGARGATQ